MNKKTPSKTRQIEFDALLPVEIELIKEKAHLVGDCFGTYDALTSFCTICADKEPCMIILQEQTKKQVKELEKIQAFLDHADLDFINKNKPKFYAKIEKDGSVSLDKFVKSMSKASKINDRQTILYWTARFVEEYGLNITGKEGEEVICLK